MAVPCRSLRPVYRGRDGLSNDACRTFCRFDSTKAIHFEYNVAPYDVGFGLVSLAFAPTLIQHQLDCNEQLAEERLTALKDAMEGASPLRPTI